MSDTSPTTTPGPEPYRVTDENLDDLASTLAKTMAEVRQHGVILDRLGSEPVPLPATDQQADGAPAAGAAAPSGPTAPPRSSSSPWAARRTPSNSPPSATG